MSAGIHIKEAGISQLTAHLFRHEAGKMVSALVGIFGIRRLQLAEDVVQEAMVRALQTWPYYGVPDNPAGWLMRTAKNRALDVIRREKNFEGKQDEIVASLEALADNGESACFDEEIRDHRLRLIFACCHPEIPLEDQTALALKTLCGFGVPEIAKAFLISESAVAKRITRAKKKIAERRIAFEIPVGEELATRLDGVLQVLYFLFNEGYKASSGDRVVRTDLCREAVRLCGLLAEHPAADQPRTHALLALMLLNGSRLSAREDEGGHLLLLEHQDRSLWDRSWIASGMMHLVRAANGRDLTEYHLQAGIAACHGTAMDYASTDWRRILVHYDHWLEMNDSPLVALNRAVAVANVKGARAGIEALELITHRRELDGYYLFHAVRADFEERLGHFHSAAAHFQKAIDLTEVTSERNFLIKRLLRCSSGADGK